MELKIYNFGKHCKQLETTLLNKCSIVKVVQGQKMVQDHLHVEYNAKLLKLIVI